MNLGRVLMLMLIPALVLAQEPTLSSTYGTAAVVVRLSAEGSPGDLEKLPLHAGDTITPQGVRNAIQILFDTGHYSSVEADASPSDTGTQLTFVVRPHYFFSTFTLQPANVLDRPLSSLVRLPVGQRFSEKQVQDVVNETTKILNDRGYFGVRVTSMLGPDNERRLRSVTLTLDIQDRDKDRARIDEVQIPKVEGVLRSEELRKALDISVGDVYSADKIDKGLTKIRELLAEKSFLNVQVRAVPEYDAAKKAVRLTVEVNPGDRAVIDTGGRIPDKEMRRLNPFFEEGQLDPELSRESHDRVVEYLQQEGYFEATVDGPKIIPASPGNPAQIRFLITEGERHHVRSIRFTGNTVFTDEVLRERIKSRVAGFLTHGLASDQLLSADVQTIQRMYRRAGYAAAFVESHKDDDPVRHEIDIVFDILENQHYTIDQLTIEGNQELSESELQPILKLKKGDFYSPAEADDAKTRLMAYYYEQGFPNVRVEATADPDPVTGGRQLRYHIYEGRRYRVGSIFVEGNTRTDINLIKRASKLEEYKYFNPEKVLAAQQRLYATGLFSHVDVVPLDVDNGDLQTILIQIEEAKTITVTPSVGYKEDVGPRLTLDISHSNILGGGRSLGMRFRWGVREQQFQTTYREPRLFNHETLDGLGTLTMERTDRPQFKARQLELSVQVRKKFSVQNSFVTSASYQTVDLKDIKLSPVVQRLIDLQKGVIHIARFGASYISDHRDNLVDAKKGMLHTSTFQIAGRPWGSQVNFVSLSHQSSYYRPKGIGTLALSGRFGLKLPYGMDNDLPITERYFAGGSTTLRGFALDEAGPPGGGQMLTIANVEYRIPIRKISIGELGTGFFYDTGNVFEKPSSFSLGNITHSAGAGLRFQTPLGPVRLDVGFDLNPKVRLNKDGVLGLEKRTQLFFTLGHAF